MKRCLPLLTAAAALLALHHTPAPAGDKIVEPALVVVDANGKEHRLNTWKFTVGTTHLAWLATAEEKDKEPAKGKKSAAGPEALEFTEGKGAPYKIRVLTYVPLTSIRSIEYDEKKETVTVHVARTDKEADDEVLTGPTGYTGCNILSIEATSDLGELGTATVKFQGGVKRGVKAIRFPNPRPAEPLPEGRGATVSQGGKDQPTFKAVDLHVLYGTGKGQTLSPTLYFKETVKIDLAKVDKLARVGNSGVDFEVTLKGGAQHPLELIVQPKGSDGKAMQLEGLVGRFGGGWRLFPMQTIGEIQFDGK
jgi:hypothetical protein